MRENSILRGEVAIVTGGYKGIGRWISEALADAGANLVIGARDYKRCQTACAEIAKLGVKVIPVKCDVSNKVDASELINTALEKFGKIDILVNNAGVTGSKKVLCDITDEEWDATMAINTRGIFYTCRAVAGEMMKRKKGKIINVTSVASFRAMISSSDYCASKAAAYMLTKCLALELARFNIQVNAICPGLFPTELNPELIAYADKNAKKLIPAGRIGNTEDLKALAVLLASSGSDYINGVAIPVDGGFLALA